MMKNNYHKNFKNQQEQHTQKLHKHQQKNQQ